MVFHYIQDENSRNRDGIYPKAEDDVFMKNI